MGEIDKVSESSQYFSTLIIICFPCQLTSTKTPVAGKCIHLKSAQLKCALSISKEMKTVEYTEILRQCKSK